MELNAMDIQVLRQAVSSMVDDPNPVQRQESLNLVFMLVSMSVSRIEHRITAFLGVQWKYTIIGRGLNQMFGEYVFEVSDQALVPPGMTIQRVRQHALADYLWAFCDNDVLESDEEFPYIELVGALQ